MRTTLFALLVMVMHFVNAQQPIPNTPGFYHVVTSTAADEQNIYVGGLVAAAGSNTSHALLFDDESNLIGELFPDSDHTVSAAASDEKDGWYLVKTSPSGSGKAKLIKILSNGDEDISFSIPEINGYVGTMLLKDDFLYLGGTFDSIGNVRCENIARIYINQNKVDESWMVKVYKERNPEVRTIVADNEYVYIGGYFNTVNDSAINHIARVSRVNGLLDEAWDPSPNAGVYTMTLDGDSLYVGGEFSQIGGQYRNHLAKMDTKNGTLFHNWLPAGDKGSIYSLVLFDDYLFAGGRLDGYWSNPGEENAQWIDVPNSNLTKYYKTTGVIDSLWKPDNRSDVWTMASIGDQIVIGTTPDIFPLSCIERYDTITGLKDTTFNLNLVGYTRAIVSKQNKLMVLGYFFLKDYMETFGLSRFNKSSGEIDKNWIPVLDLGWNNDNKYLTKIIIPDKDDVYVANSTEISLLFKDEGKEIINEGIKPVVKIDIHTGIVDDNWSPDIYGEIFTMVHDQEALYIGGLFATTGADSIPYLAKIDKATGNVDPFWNPVVNGFISKLHIDGEMLYVGGDFTSINGKPVQRLARISLQTGLVDESWLPQPSDMVHDFLVDDHHLFVSGKFHVIGGAAMPAFAKINRADGIAAEGWMYQMDYFPLSVLALNNDLLAPVMKPTSEITILRINKENGVPYDDGLPDIDIRHWGDAIPAVVNLLYDEQILYFGGMFTNINSKNKMSFAGFDIPIPVITAQPHNLSTCENSSQSVGIAVHSEALPITYQWQSSNNITGWIDIPGATNPTLFSDEIGEDLRGVGLRCIVSDRNGSVISDSFVVEVYPVYETVEHLSICQGTSAFWHGGHYFDPGTHTKVYTTVNGCDSVFVLNLNFLPSYKFTENQHICMGGEFSWRDEIYYENGTYYKNYQTVDGCDSTYVLKLFVTAVFEIEEEVVICEGEVYTWDGKQYDATGTYTKSFKTSFGCDSIISLELEVETVDHSVTQNGDELSANTSDAKYQWCICDTDQPIEGAVMQVFTPESNGSYYVLITQNNCVKKSDCYTVTGVGKNDSPFDKHFILYPNPVNGSVILETGVSIFDADIEIVNTKGQRVLKYIGQSGNQFVFDLSKQKNGSYHLIVSQGSGVNIIPFLISR